MKDTKDQIRKTVSEAYAKAVSEPEKGCCSSSTTSPLMKLAGYGQDELAELPEGVQATSFGCGNPLAFAEVQEGQTVLDLGSGAGLDLMVAARKVGPSGTVIGVDMTDDMIARARENIRESGLDYVEVRKGLIEELPVDDASVDWVISNCVINLSPDKPAVFREIARVLKPGGRMSISDIVAEELPQWVLESDAMHCSCVSGAVSEQVYLQGLRDAGLEDVTVVERLPYGDAELAALLNSEEMRSLIPDGAMIDRAARELAGMVQSIRVSARKS